MEVVDDTTEFFAPVSADVVDGLIGQYDNMRRKLEAMAELATGEQYRGALQYFIEGNASENRHDRAPSVERLFELEGAIAALNAQYWGRALELTDVYECMPQKRRNEWNAQLRNPRGVRTRGLRGEPDYWTQEPLPAFEEATVRQTLTGLLAARTQFFAERVDGVFRGLSGEHVTNRPEGFGKRMIISYVLSFGSVSHDRAGLINDLRCVIAKFMGRDEPRHQSMQPLLARMNQSTGEWHTVDGGAMRIRAYKKGTAHLEVHPDMAWRLNQVLAHLYPLAIPAEFRARPKNRIKEFTLMQRPLPFAVLEVLGMVAYGHRPGKVYCLSHDARKKGRAYDEACHVLELLGGVATGAGEFSFDYVPDPVIDQVMLTGCVPDQKSHQFYPTRDYLGELATELAEIGPEDTVLEPEAGRGDLAKRLPLDQTTCVEISSLHCEILRACGFTTIQADFLEYAVKARAAGIRYSRVVMNPPFSDGRAQLHVEHASQLLGADGILVAILPAGMRGKNFLLGFEHEWSRLHDNEFAGTTVSVVLLKARRVLPTDISPLHDRRQSKGRKPRQS